MKVHQGKYGKRGRKVSVHIAPEDTWGLDHSLAYIILPALLHLREHKQGVPSEFGEVGGGDWESQDSFDFYKETHSDAFNISCEKWNEILDKMIWSFQQIALDKVDGLYYHGNAEYELVPGGQHMNVLTGQMEEWTEHRDKDPRSHWLDIVGIEEHERRIQEGIDLFAKYYRSLWD